MDGKDDSQNNGTWQWRDKHNKSQLIADKKEEIRKQKIIVDYLKEVSTDLGEYAGDLDTLSNDYTKMIGKFSEVGQFGTDNIDAKGLFSGSKESIDTMQSSITSLKSQVDEDHTTNDTKLTNLNDELNAPHFGQEYVLVNNQ